MNKKVAGGIALATLLPALAVGAWLLFSGGCVDKTVSQPWTERDLTVKEIREKLRSGDFKQQLEASKQIDKLAPPERLQVLLVLADDPSAPTRILAVKKLRLLEVPAARDKVAKMAKDDPDSTVRELASKPGAK